jgi:hypothetical protein
MVLTPFDTARAIALIQDVVSKELSNGFQKPKAIPEELEQTEQSLG